MKPRAASSRNANLYGRFFAPLTFSVFATLCFFLGVPALSAQTAKAPAVPAPTKASAKTSQNQLSSPAIESKVSALLAKMTLEEKIGQLVQYSAGAATGPTSGRTDDKDMP